MFLSKVRKFDTPLESSLFEDEVPKELFYKVLDMANNKYHSYLLDYVDTIKKVLNKENLFIYDTSLPLVDNINFNYSLEDAYKLIIEATKNLGPTYKKVLQKARVENWIDYMPHKGKRHGAYSSGSYDTSPYILMSYTNDIESIFTLIHELGHSIHTYFSNTTQPYFTHSYRIFVAEVASTVNENLLMYTLLKNSSTKEEKAFLLYRKLQENIGLLYRQPFFANFEDLLHKKLANNETLSNKFITDLYESLTNDYWGNKVQLNEYTKYSCYYIPHFYYNYYVYKYTVGQCVASVIAKKIFNNDEKQIYSYLNFLKSGSSKSPIELLKDTGVNPLEDNIYDDAFREFKQTLDEFNNLI